MSSRFLSLAQDFATEDGKDDDFVKTYQTFRRVFGVHESVKYTLIALYDEQIADKLEADWI